MNLEKEEYIKKWLLKANEDIAVIERLLEFEPEQYTSAICFHCQQAVEKFLKAVLIKNDIDFPKTHDLDYLLDECRKIDSKLYKNIDLKSLSDYGVSIRYPDDFFIPELEEAKYYYEVAEKIKQIIENYLNQK